MGVGLLPNSPAKNLLPVGNIETSSINERKVGTMIVRNLHTGITVSDLDRSIAFYRDVVGLTLDRREPPRATRAQKLGVPGAVVEIAVMRYGDKNDSVELIQYKEPLPPNAFGAPVNAIGQAHLAFKVDDIAAEIKRMSALGLEFVGGNDYGETLEGPLKGWKWIYFKDPDGMNLELIEGDLED
jgi:catechol 2,3-dioxygenase-like lactoylglutathione lyase family enzyme